MKRFLWRIQVVVVALIALAPTTSGAQEDDWATWSKLPDPVFSGQYIASDATLVVEPDFYRMYTTCFTISPDGFSPETTRAAFCASTSTDGLNWTPVPVDGPFEGLVFQGREDAWDQDVEAAFVTKRDGRYLLYYSGYRHSGGVPAQGFPAALGVAESTDGVTFRRVSSDPILEPTPGWYDNDAVYSPTIVEYEDGLLMVYAGHCYTNCDFGFGVTLLGATSIDGITWTKLDEPILTAGGTGLNWTRDGVAEPALVLGPDNRWYLFFTGLLDEKRWIGQAVSDAPFGPWTIDPKPIVVDSDTPGAFDEASVLAPFVLIEDERVRMWFLGFTPEERIAIGYAETTWPLYSSPATE